MPFVSLSDVSKQCGDALLCSNVNMTVDRGQFCLLKGDDVYCKEALLDIIGGMDKPTSGAVEIDGVDLASLTGGKLNKYRRRVGFVFADETTVCGLTAGENIMLSARLGKTKASADKLLAAVGLDSIADQPVDSLDDKQRLLVCVARALARRPELFLFDAHGEMFDAHSLFKVASFVKKMCEKFDMTAIVSVGNDRLDGLADMCYIFDYCDECGGGANE